MAGVSLSRGIESVRGRYHYLPADWVPPLPSGESDDSWLRFARELESLPDFFFHLGGAGDALLLLATFYDENPDSWVLSVPNSLEVMEDFFLAFPRLRGVFFLPRPESYPRLDLLRAVVHFLKKKGKCLGTGITPAGDYRDEWRPGLDPFRTFGVAEKPAWAAEMGEERLCRPQVTVAPRGSNLGMPQGKQNVVPPEVWDGLLQDLVGRGLTPVLLGTPMERAIYPAREGCLDRRSWSFSSQMRLIAGSDLLVAADSWHKTFAGLLGKKTLLFLPIQEGPARLVPDISQEVFIRPWKGIVPVGDFQDYLEALDESFPRPGGRKSLPGEAILTSFSPLFWDRRYGEGGEVLVRAGSAVGDALMTTAVLRALKEAHPGLEITASSLPALEWIFRGCPSAVRWVPSGSGAEKDAASRAVEIVDFRGVLSRLPEYLGGIHFMDILANLAGVTLGGDDLQTSPSEEALAWAREEMEGFAGGRSLVGLHLHSSKDPARSYPKGRELVEALARIDPELRFAYFGTEPLPGAGADTYDFAARRVPLERQAAAASFCRAFLCVDSAFLHVAQNLWSKPVLLLAGPTHPGLIGNRRKGLRALTAPGLECGGCYWRRSCGRECVLRLDPLDVARAFLGGFHGDAVRAGFPLPERELVIQPGREDFQLQIARALAAPGGPFRLLVRDPHGLLPGEAPRWNGIEVEGPG